MKTYLECMPCFIKQALQAGRIAGDDPVVHKKILDAVAAEIPAINIDDCPPKMGRRVHEIVKRITGNQDPYKTLKEKYNRQAMALYPYLKEKIKASSDPLETAVRTAIAGNVIDFGAQLEFDLESDLNDILHGSFAVFDYGSLKEKLVSEKEVLYLGDNAGETVFDRVLIEEIISSFGPSVTYAVKEKPIINDATMEDAVFAGIDKSAKVISSGSDGPGTIPEYCSDEFNELFRKAPLVISKGQGNYEALSETEKPVFFLLKVKCDVLAAHMKVPIGSIILKAQGY